ncbi:MAG: ABC transporter permease, partial [Defluviitaleaceae bacterium]|nr:ABC transporter permease [Defluviitaleaceae bacterium]
MNLFFRFVGYEYKKIFMRKSAIIVIVGALLFSVFVQVSLLLPGFTAPADESAWARMQQDREYARALSGRA